MKKVTKVILWIVILFVATLALLSVVRFLFTPYVAVSDSMEPTISKSDWNIVSRLHYSFADIRREDIVLFKPCPNFFEKGKWIHRIIALPGDTVEIQDGTVAVNGLPATFPDTVVKNDTILVPEGFVYQKGDGTKSILGLVPMNCIAGKLIYTKEGVY